MIAMTVKEFDSLGKRDWDNGAVRDSIRIALEEREKLLQSRQPSVTRCVITQGEFLEFCGEIQRRFTDEKDGQRYFLLGAGIQMYCEDWLKSKGVEVEEKP